MAAMSWSCPVDGGAFGVAGHDSPWQGYLVVDVDDGGANATAGSGHSRTGLISLAGRGLIEMRRFDNRPAR